MSELLFYHRLNRAVHLLYKQDFSLIDQQMGTHDTRFQKRGFKNINATKNNALNTKSFI